MTSRDDKRRVATSEDLLNLTLPKLQELYDAAFTPSHAREKLDLTDTRNIFERNNAPSTTPQKPVDPESEEANPVWDLVIQTCAQAWPAGLLTWSQSPTELIVKIIDERDEARSALSAMGEKPLPMVLHCPACGLQHVDAKETHGLDDGEQEPEEPAWNNPPHRSHLCHGCGCIWRPADVPTNGVKAITTRGKADTWPNNSPDGTVKT